MKTLKISGGIVLVLVLLFLGMNFPKSNPVVNQILGATPGPDVFQRTFFHQGVVVGGNVYATSSTATTYTLTAAEVAAMGDSGIVKWTPNISTTLSIDATSTASLIPNIGDRAEILIRNASSTAAATITIAAANTDVDLQKNEDTADLAIAGLDWARLTFIRNSASFGTSQVTVLMEELTEAD